MWKGGVNKILVIKLTLLMQQVSLYFNTKTPGKRVSKNIQSPWKSTVYNIVSRAEKEERLDWKGSTGRPKKVTQRVESKVIKTVWDSPQSSARVLALQVKYDSGLLVSHETIRNVLEKHKYSSRVTRKKNLRC